VASVNDLVSSLQSVIDKVDEALAEAATAESVCDDLIAQMSSAGIQDKVAELTAVKSAIDALRTHLAGGTDLAKQARDHARAAGG
jgi:hypothetical protein